MKKTNTNNTIKNTSKKEFDKQDRVLRLNAQRLAKETLVQSESYIAKFFPEMKKAAMKGTDALLEHFSKMNGLYLVNPAFAESKEDAFVRAYAFRRMIHTLVFVTNGHKGMTSYLCDILEGRAHEHICNWFDAEHQNAWHEPMNILIDGEI